MEEIENILLDAKVHMAAGALSRLIGPKRPRLRDMFRLGDDVRKPVSVSFPEWEALSHNVVWQYQFVDYLVGNNITSGKSGRYFVDVDGRLQIINLLHDYKNDGKNLRQIILNFTPEESDQINLDLGSFEPELEPESDVTLFQDSSKNFDSDESIQESETELLKKLLITSLELQGRFAENLIFIRDKQEELGDKIDMLIEHLSDPKRENVNHEVESVPIPNNLESKAKLEFVANSLASLQDKLLKLTDGK